MTGNFFKDLNSLLNDGFPSKEEYVSRLKFDKKKSTNKSIDLNSIKQHMPYNLAMAFDFIFTANSGDEIDIKHLEDAERWIRREILRRSGKRYDGEV